MTYTCSKCGSQKSFCDRGGNEISVVGMCADCFAPLMENIPPITPDEFLERLQQPGIVYYDEATEFTDVQREYLLTKRPTP